MILNLIYRTVKPAVSLPLILFSGMLIMTSCKKDQGTNTGTLELISCFVGNIQLQNAAEITNVPLNQDIELIFSAPLDTIQAKKSIILKDHTGTTVSGIRFVFTPDYTTVKLRHSQNLLKLEHYILAVTSSLKGSSGQSFSGAEFGFTTISGIFTLENILLDNRNFNQPNKPNNIKRIGSALKLDFSDALDTVQIRSKFTLSGNAIYNVTYSNNFKTVNLVCPVGLEGYKKYNFSVSLNLKSVSGSSFGGFDNTFMTEIDSSLKFPLITDDQLLTLIQQQTFKYFYNYAHPSCGMARERLNSADVVTTGGSGFGVMALVVGMERNFITRNEGISRMDKILHFLETCDRFHGAWPHWLNGNTGKTVPFSPNDNGGDLVETSYMIQGLLTMRQYLNPADGTENSLIGRINDLCSTVEYDWFTNGGQNSLFWHWSPTTGWLINFRIEGYNETLITYVVAATSVTHPIPAIAYHQGYARNGAIVNGNLYYGIKLPLGEPYGGPLFFSQYSYLGLDPRNLSDMYANYWEQNVNQSLINHAYCKDNPKKYVGYGDQSWGLTASDNPWGYSAHSPTNDLGVISPTAAVSALPYTPVQSMDAIRRFYYILGDKLWGPYGFYDAFDVTDSYWVTSYISIDQGPQICMIENYRSRLLWNLFMSCPEVQAGLTKLGFTYK